VGHSWGADIVLHFALQHPERLSKLVLVEPGLLSPLAEVYRSPGAVHLELLQERHFRQLYRRRATGRGQPIDRPLHVLGGSERHRAALRRGAAGDAEGHETAEADDRRVPAATQPPRHAATAPPVECAPPHAPPG